MVPVERLFAGLLLFAPDQVKRATDGGKQETHCHMKVIDHVVHGDQFHLKEKIDGSEQHYQAGKDAKNPGEILQVFHFIRDGLIK
jgi:hypothetical protein